MKKIIALATVLSLASCAWWSSKEPAVAAAAETCASKDLGQLVGSGSDQASLVMTVIGIIVGGAVNWEAELTALATKYGPEAIECAVQVAESLFRSSTGSATAAPSSTEQSFPGAHDRAVKYLQDHLAAAK